MWYNIIKKGSETMEEKKKRGRPKNLDAKKRITFRIRPALIKWLNENIDNKSLYIENLLDIEIERQKIIKK